MPRAVDPSLVGQQLPIDHTPLNRIEYQNRAPQFDLIAMITQIVTFISNLLFPAIKNLTGIDLSSLTQLTQSLFSLPTFITQIINSLLSSTVGFLTGASPLSVLNLFGIIPQTILGFLPFSSVGQGNPNLLSNPSFDGAISVQGGKMWLWDPNIGNTSPGSVYCTANSQLKQLRSNVIPVSIGQELAMSVYAMWSGLTYTGTPIKTQVVRFLEGNAIGVDDLASPPTPGANQASWLEIASNYTVPGGCDNICLQIAVASTVTAGTIRFDDGDVHKTGSSAVFVPTENVSGVGGLVNIGATISGTWNAIVGGLVGVLGGVGAGIADLFGVTQDISSRASLGMYSWEVLGVRNNKPIDQGLLATSNSNFSLGRVAMQSSAPTIAVTQSVSAIGFLRMAESNDKGVVSWLGQGTANITGCYVNIWEMDATTGDMTLMHRSPNIVGNLSASMSWVIYDYPDDMILTHAGDVWGIEITITGTGTHTVAGTTTWIPPHPSSFPKTYAATRNSGTGTPAIGTVIPAASVNYSTNIPWIEWGIVVGGFGTHPDEISQFTEAGTGTLPIPDWANYVDVIVLGGGGAGGQGGYFGSPGFPGGAAGDWRTATWARGTDFSGTTVINVTVGAGGIYGVGNGENSVVSIPGHTVTAPGGVSASSPGQYGEGAGNQDYLGLTYVGGIDSWGEGAIPGGGGTSGADFISGPGLSGARGGVWTVFRENE